jgi:DNA-binding XRE family transcriptional regulator
VIANDREYRITSATIKRLEEGLAHAESRHLAHDPLAHQLICEGIEGQLETLREQVQEYEALRNGQITFLEADSLDQLPDILIRARIAARLTQKALAARLGLKEQQVQRYEATRYASASLERVQAIAAALGVRLQGRVTFPITTIEPASDSTSDVGPPVTGRKSEAPATV